MRVFRTLALAAVVCASLAASAQKNELSVTVGANIPKNNVFDTKNAFAIGGTYDRRLVHVPLASLYIDVPVYVGVNNSQQLTTPQEYSSIFVTPGLKLKFAPEFPVSPWVVVGGGIARYHQTSGIANGDSETKGAFEYGGGIDMKILPYISLRAEVRDFYSNAPTIGSAPESHQHNIVPAGGIVFRF